MLEFIRVFLRENNTHSHLSIKNNVKSLFLLMFLALCAKMEKKGREGRKEGWLGGEGKQKPPQHAQSKFSKRAEKPTSRLQMLVRC